MHNKTLVDRYYVNDLKNKLKKNMDALLKSESAKISGLTEEVLN